MVLWCFWVVGGRKVGGKGVEFGLEANRRSDRR